MMGYKPRLPEVKNAKHASQALLILWPLQRQPQNYNSFITEMASSNESSPPKPIPSSYQQLGKTLQDFLDRVKQKLAEYAATEDIQECKSCFDAEQQAEHEWQDLTLAKPTIGSGVFLCQPLDGSTA